MTQEAVKLTLKAEMALHSIVEIPAKNLKDTDSLWGVIRLPGGQQIVTGSDGSLRVWNLESRKQIGEDWKDGVK